MKKLLLSVLSIAVVVGVGVYATNAFFSDEETSTGNTFQAGAIDLKVDSTAHYAGLVCSIGGLWVEDAIGPSNNTRPELLNTACDLSWELTDLTQASRFFNYTDLKPGDEGENTISLHIYDNDAWACVNIIPTMNDDVTTNEPELEAGDVANTDSIYDGELAQNMTFSIWADVCEGGLNGNSEAVPGDNIYQEDCDIPLTTGAGPITPTSYALADSTHLNVFTGVNGPLVGTQDYYLGVAWGIPDAVGNIIQTDKYMADISFYVEQSRNNPNFVCNTPTPPEQRPSLKLENETIVEDGPWLIIEDNTFATLTWDGDKETFDYDLVAQNLPANTDYSLIYYADGWPGDNPGKFIGSHSSDAAGAINDTGQSVNLDLDLPDPADGNYAVGAKIWLVLASDYNNGVAATGPMTAWNPSQYLFEGNVYIEYDDTNWP